jgi:dTDP-glucose 4,6-dehydratase
MNKRKVLITGVLGFIMSNFVRKFVYENAPYEFISIDKITNAANANSIYANKNHEFILADITDTHIIDRIFEIQRPEIVIHAAAETFVDYSLQNPNIFITTNVLGTQILVNASVKWGVKKFVFVSSDEVYGQLEKETDPPWPETSPLSPRNPYAASKACGEMVVQAAGTSFGLPYCITRSSNTYGPRQTAEKFIPKIIKSVLDNTKIPVYDRGLQMRDWLYVSDACSGIMKVVEEGKDKEIYNITANQEYPNIEVVQLLCNALCKGYDLIEFVKDPRGNAHDFRYAIDATKIKSLGWEPKFKFKSGILQTVDWYTKNKFFLK